MHFKTVAGHCNFSGFIFSFYHKIYFLFFGHLFNNIVWFDVYFLSCACLFKLQTVSCFGSFINQHQTSCISCASVTLTSTNAVSLTSYSINDGSLINTVGTPCSFLMLPSSSFLHATTSKLAANRLNSTFSFWTFFRLRQKHTQHICIYNIVAQKNR